LRFIRADLVPDQFRVSHLAQLSLNSTQTKQPWLDRRDKKILIPANYGCVATPGGGLAEAQ